MLPPEDGSGRGQGFVSYLIRARPDLPCGTEIRNVATIQFDFGLSIDTNQVDPLDKTKGTDPDLEARVTLDGHPPVSAVLPLPEVVQAPFFNVGWEGEDSENGSGVAAFDIHVRADAGPWVAWLQGTSARSAVFQGDDGVSYAFYSVAVDNVGNREAFAPVPQAVTRVEVAEDVFTVVLSAVPEAGGTVSGGGTLARGAVVPRKWSLGIPVEVAPHRSRDFPDLWLQVFFGWLSSGAPSNRSRHHSRRAAGNLGYPPTVATRSAAKQKQPDDVTCLYPMETANR